MTRKPQTAWTRTIKAMRSETAQKWSHRAPALMVAGVALYVSYWHIRGEALAHGYDVVGAAILPLSVDGLVIVSARYVTRAKTTVGRLSAGLGFFLGVLATLAGNLLTADGTLVGIGFATWPAVAVVVTGVILHWGDAKAKPAPRAPRKAAQTTTTATQAIPRQRKTINSTALSEPSAVPAA